MTSKKIYVRTTTLNEICQMADIPFSILPYVAGDCGGQLTLGRVNSIIHLDRTSLQCVRRSSNRTWSLLDWGIIE